MRPLLLALVLLPFAAQAHDDHDHDHAHGSLGKHEHGVAQLNVALDGKTLELELDSPAMNLVGFEHAASTDADKAAVAKARAQLENRWSCSPCQSPPAARWPARNCGVRCSATRRRPTRTRRRQATNTNTNTNTVMPISMPITSSVARSPSCSSC